MCHRPSWLYHLIIFSACRQDIIVYTTMTFIATGAIGVVIATGTINPGIENIPSVIGVAESFIGSQHTILAIEGLATGDLESSTMIEDLPTGDPESSTMIEDLMTKELESSLGVIGGPVTEELESSLGVIGVPVTEELESSLGVIGVPVTKHLAVEGQVVQDLKLIARQSPNNFFHLEQ